MRLLLVVGSFPHRSETFIYRKVVALARRGHAVTVGSRKRGDWSIYPDPLPATLALEIWPPDTGLRSVDSALAAFMGTARALARSRWRLRELFERIREDPRTRDQPRMHFMRHLPFLAREVDVIHFEFLGLATMYPLARDLTGARIVVSCRGTETNTLTQRSAHEQAAILDAYRSVDAVHCVSADLAHTMAQLGGERANVREIRPAVDTDAIRPPPVRRGEQLRIITTGRLVWQKGLDHLLAALARLRQRNVPFHAEILGDGELRNLLSFSIDDLGLTNHVTLVGAVTSAEVLSRMRDANVFVLSSLTEGISNAAIEAMASGLPIVTTAAGGMPEIVTDGVEGFVVPVRDSDAIADRLERLARDPDRRATMGAAARSRAERELSIEHQIASFEELYTSLLGSSPSSR